MDSEDYENSFDVTVIGGGWSGILACKYCIEEGLTVTVLETRDKIGGVWCYSEEKNIPTVMKTTRASSSATVTEMSDFEMPNDIGEFPHHEDILNYLHAYCRKYELFDHIQLNTKVLMVRKENKKWITTTDKNQEIRSTFLIVCTGIHQSPDRSVEETIFKDFTGTIFHSGELKYVDSSCVGKRVLVFGGGETASDIVENWHSSCQKLIWSIPRGQHFFRKYAKLLPNREPQALDKASSRAMKLVSPFTKSKPGISWACKWTTNGSLLAYQGHGIPEWRNSAAFFHSFINKQGHVLDFIDYKTVIPKASIVATCGSFISFEDSATEEIDIVILCTGYNVTFPFLPQSYGSPVMNKKYKFVFDASDPSLAFIGYVRPIVGSIPAIAEVQARWVARIFSGKIQLASIEERKKAIANDTAFWHKYFKETSHRLSTLVEGYTYTDDIAKLSKCYPEYWSLFRHSPMDFKTAYFAPYNGCSFVLNEPKHQEQALERLKKHSKGTMSPFFILFFLLLRFLWFDWILERLGDCKYFIQRSTVWKRIHSYRLVKEANRVWSLPKQYLFDQQHYH